MVLNRLLLLVFILITGILASFYGGNISYALFYTALAIPVVAFSYTLYVYFRFKLYQTIGKRTVVKGEATEYIFQLSNEDVLSYENIKVNFYHDKSKILGAEEESEYTLLPGERSSMETLICCNYRGEYYVGVQTVTITDFLYLFSVTYPVFSKMKVTVLPRVVTLTSLKMLSPNLDTKGRMKRLNEVEEEADIEVRKYVSGDNKKRIHWKASAKKRELLTRKYTSIPKTGVTVFWDLSAVVEDELTKIIIEDKIIESGIAIAEYCKRKRIPCRLQYEQGGIVHHVIQGQSDFDLLYHRCVDLRFAAEQSIDKLVDQALLSGEIYMANGLYQYIIITHFVTEELYKTALKLIQSGSECIILFVEDYLTPDVEHLLKLSRDAGIGITVIQHNDEIAEAL